MLAFAALLENPSLILPPHLYRAAHDTQELQLRGVCLSVTLFRPPQSCTHVTRTHNDTDTDTQTKILINLFCKEEKVMLELSWDCTEILFL